jgi:hypothetical protein
MIFISSMTDFQVRFLYDEKVLSLKGLTIFDLEACESHDWLTSSERVPSSSGWSNNHVFFMGKCSPTIILPRTSLGMWPPYLSIRNFLIHRESPSTSVVCCGPRIVGTRTVGSDQRSPNEQSIITNLEGDTGRCGGKESCRKIQRR